MVKRLVARIMAALFVLIMLESVTVNLIWAASAAPSAEGKNTRNVALNAKVTASGQCNSNEGGKNAVDGDSTTKWCDNSSGAGKWLKLDLGKVYTINEWVVYNAAFSESGNVPFWNTKDFRLQKSMDGKKWETVDVVRNNVQTVVDRYVPAFSSRYVRFYVERGAHDNNTVRLYELELYGVDEGQEPDYPATNKLPVDYVDPFINTLGDNGQTNPGPSTPFGLVSLGPDGDGGAFSGYYYQDKNLKGFSHLRFSGVGCSGGGGNILMMPETRTFTNNSGEYKQKYDKSSEQASPGYYGVELASGINAELTTSDNVGFHRYTFPANEADGSVLVDLSNSYAGMLDANLTVENNNEISGMIQSKNVCGYGNYKLYYSIQFDHDFASYTSWKGNDTGAVPQRSGSNTGVWLDFDTQNNKVIQAKVGISPISVEQAKSERDHDISGWDFDAQHQKARSMWSEVLNKIEITDNDEKEKTIFYTQLYHMFLHPKNVTSSAGEFRAGRDENTIRNTSELGDDFEYYSGWSTWDDFRKYPLYSILEPKKYENMVKSLVDLYRTRGTYTQYGDGYWPSPTVRNEFNGAVILDAYSKGFTDFDAYTALEGMAVDTDHYVYSDNDVSGKLERAYSAYFPMRLAEMLGDKDTYAKYRDIALSYKKLWNPGQVDEKGEKRGFFTPNARNVSASEITQVDKYAYQGNLWQYRFFVLQDIAGLADLMGGIREMAGELLHFFEINEYMAVNETAPLDAPYLFNYLRMPYLTQYYAREYTTEVVTQNYHNHGRYAFPIKSRVYRDDPEGYLPTMDDDAGAMASWYVYSAMGIYPGNPGEAMFLIGSPIFSEVKLHLDNGKTFTIKANNVSSDNRFIQSAELNGSNFDQAWIRYEDIMQGGTLEFSMGSVPNTSWGASKAAMPPATDYSTEVDNNLIRQDLIAEKSEWKYLDKGKYAGAGWTNLNFDDSSWAAGRAVLGYDNKGFANTVVSYGPDGNNKYPTTYFRKTFEVTDLQDITKLEAGLIRDDGAVVYLNGREIIRTNMPQGNVDYGTYANATVGDERNMNSYVIDPSYLVEGTNVLTAEVHQVNATSSDIAFEFSLAAVKQMTKPAAPTHPVVDDAANTFGWTSVPGYDQPADYEFTTDGGAHWQTATSNPQIVGPAEYEVGEIQVRVKKDEGQGRTTGEALKSDKPYTSDVLWDVFDLEADVNRKGNMKVDISGTLKGQYVDSAVAVFQLMNGSEQAWVSNAVPVATGSFQLSQSFNVNAGNYQLNIYLVDEYNGNVYDSLWLADPIVSQAEPVPAPTPDPEPEPDPGTPGDEEIEPLPLPVKEEEPPIVEIPEDGEQPGSSGMFEFEERSAWTSAVNTFNNNPLKTESGNGGTVVANTFTGAWLSFEDADFGAEGVNHIAVEYDAPASRTPADGILEVRLGGVDGELVGTVQLPNTGSGWGTYKTAVANLNKTLTGTQDVYLVMKGSTDSTRLYMGNFDRFTLDYVKIRNDYARLELEKYDQWSTSANPANNGPLKTEAGKSGQQVANTFDGAWLAYLNMDFGNTGVNQFSIEYAGNTGNTAADAAVEIRLGGVDGTLVGKVATPPTASSWGTYATVTGSLTQTLTGMQDVYLVFKGKTDSTYKYIGNFDNASFSASTVPEQPEEPEQPGQPEQPEADVTLQFENRSAWTSAVNTFNNKPLKTESNNGGTVVGNTFTGAWLAFNDVNFGTKGKNNVEIVYDAPSQKAPADVTAEIRLNDANGELVGTVKLPNTGSGWGTYKTASAKLDRTLSGAQTVCIVFKGTTTSGLMYVGNLDSMTFTAAE
ncbi:GH92 family glycosyl hydrolase [Paenibacillus medicaginis]|uniref:GH92 family glycosyl hydrolase n=1 Tax=Paenibacillus medicaginis TaxID=1470560 RepID=A0ABV5C5E5_9BACL